jgi:putative ABC transport system permease protein
VTREQWKDRLTWIFRRKRAQNDLDEEIQAHLAIEERERIEAGASPADARCAARKDFGNELLVRETARDVWSWRWVEDLFRDLLYGIRVLRKNPGFATVAILTLALGIGCNTAMFSVINSVLLRPLPFHEPDRLIYMLESQPSDGYDVTTLNGQDFLDWKAQNHTLEDATLFGAPQNFNASGAGEAETVRVCATEANFLSVLGVHPLRGRGFLAGEDMPDRNKVVVLGYGFWQMHYAGRNEAIGTTLLLDSQPYTVVGVLPPWFNTPTRTQLWVPLDMQQQREEPRENHSYRAIGRMKPGVTLAEVRADLDAISARLAAQYPASNHGETSWLQPLKERFAGDSRQPLLVLMGAVALVLLVACANVANLLLSRATGRQREMALRTALGARRLRLVRQLLTESVLLSIIGAALGVLLAELSVSAIRQSPTLPIPQQTPVQVDWRVLVFAGALSVIVGLLFGLAPLFQISVQRLAEALKAAMQSVSASGWRNRLRDALVVGEIALSLALLMGAGLLLRSFVRLRSADIGIARENVTTMALVLPKATYKGVLTRHNFYRQLLDAIHNEPGVQSAAISLVLPLEGSRGRSVETIGEASGKHAIQWNVVTEDYFHTLGIPVLAGRTFNAQDLQMTAENEARLDPIRERNPNSLQPDNYPIVINQTLAKALFHGQNAVGKSLKMGTDTGEIIGVVGDVKQESIREPARPEAFGPLPVEISNHWYPAQFSIHWTKSGASIVSAARHDLAQLDRNLSFFNIRTMDDVVADNMQDTSLETALLGAFAAMALLLAAIGLYGVMAYAVAQRTREIGIRMALGAQPRAVLGMVMGRGGFLTLTGVLLGAPAAFGLARMMRNLLFGVGAADLATFVAVALLLALVAMMACYVPARRAMRVDAVIALRYE